MLPLHPTPRKALGETPRLSVRVHVWVAARALVATLTFQSRWGACVRLAATPPIPPIHIPRTPHGQKLGRSHAPGDGTVEVAVATLHNRRNMGSRDAARIA